MSTVSPIRRLRHIVRTLVAEHPALYLPFARRKYPGPSPEVVSEEAEIVIDGYTRSATTFAVHAFQLAQDRPVRMAHHLHAPAQLIAAAKMQIPTVALIREPEGAILSQLVREPHVVLRDAMVAYVRFYSRVLPYRSSFVVGEFEEVTRDFGSVIRRLNERFGTSFAEFEHTDDNLRECFDLIKERPTPIPAWSLIVLGFESGLVTASELRSAREYFARRAEPVGKKEVWVPSAERERSKEMLRDQWRRTDLRSLRRRAELVYEKFVAGAEVEA